MPRFEVTVTHIYKTVYIVDKAEDEEVAEHFVYNECSNVGETTLLQETGPSYCYDLHNYETEEVPSQYSFHVGQKVWWADPDGGICSGVKFITTIDYMRETVELKDDVANDSAVHVPMSEIVEIVSLLP